MAHYTAVLVDDEPLAREGLRQLLAGEPDITIVGEAGDGVDALALIERTRPDILFLDIQMPGLDGFTIVSALPRERRPAIIFITAYDRFAIEAFTVHAVDYLLKPVDPARFRDALQHAREHLGSPADTGESNMLALLADLANRQQYPERLMIRSSGKITFVPTAEISFVEAAGDYVCLHTKTQKHLLHETLQDLCERLDPAKFIRIHRSTIVNVGSIKELQPLFRGDYAVILHDGRKLTLSRRYREKVLSTLGR